MIGVSLRKSRLFWGPLLIDVCNVLQSKAEYKRANPESYWCTTCILWAHIKPTVRTEAQPWRPLMWGCNWHTNERAIAQRGTSRCVAAVGQSKYQRGRQWRRGTKCCFRPLKVKASQPRIHPKYWWLKLTLNYNVATFFVDFGLNFFSCECASLCSPTASVWALCPTILACVLHSCRHVISLALALCPLGAMCRDALQAAQTVTMATTRQEGMQVSERSRCPCWTFSYNICLCAVPQKKNIRPLSETVYTRCRWRVCAWNIPDH